MAGPWSAWAVEASVEIMDMLEQGVARGVEVSERQASLCAVVQLMSILACLKELVLELRTSQARKNEL
jgi:hypothetical protein